jgi:hypothetical protein
VTSNDAQNTTQEMKENDLTKYCGRSMVIQKGKEFLRNYPTINEALEDFKIGYPSLTNSYRHHDKAEPVRKSLLWNTFTNRSPTT